MLSDIIFKQGIDMINNAGPQKIHPGSLSMWHELLNEDGFNDSDFLAGVKLCCKNEKSSYLPTIGILIEYCNTIKSERWAKEERIKKAQNLKDDKTIWDDEAATKMGQRAIMINRFMLEKDDLTPKQKVDYMLKMEEHYPDKGWLSQAMALKREYESMGVWKDEEN